MKNILLIQSSPRGPESYSQRVAESIVNEIMDRNPGTTVTFRDLAEDPLPHVGPAFISSLSAKPGELTAEQRDALALSDALIEELQTADIVVLAVPMHNFGIPSTLKAWIDHVVRAGRTFTYSEGLLKGKRLILVLASEAFTPKVRRSKAIFRSRISVPSSVSSDSPTLKSYALKEWR